MAVAMMPAMMPLELSPAAALSPMSNETPQAKAGRSPLSQSDASPSSPRSAMKEKKAQQLRDNAVTMQLTKTKLCAFFERGKCASSNCRYAHSEQELRLPPNLQKTKLCRAFLGGSCNNENCYFAHGETDLRVTEGIYKTQICNFFERGYCKKGDRCNHAHGNVDLRPATPTAASTPMGKTSQRGVESTRPRRSPLPLSELLVIDSEANSNMLSPTYSTIPPTPTKSVVDLAQMAYSPVNTSPMWAQYGMHPLSPVSGYGPVADLAAMYAPRDAVDMLVQDQHHQHHMMSPMSPMGNTNLMYAMEAMEPTMELLEHQLPMHSTPMRGLELHCLDPSPNHHATPPGLIAPMHNTPPRAVPSMLGCYGYAYTEPPRQAPLTSPMLFSGGAPGLEEPQLPPPPATEAGVRDPLMVNLSERLASLDAVVKNLGSDIQSIKNDPNKKLHRI